MLENLGFAKRKLWGCTTEIIRSPSSGSSVLACRSCASICLALTPVVKWLLIVNIGVFVLSLIGPLGNFLETWFAVDPRIVAHDAPAVAADQLPVSPQPHRHLAHLRQHARPVHARTGAGAILGQPQVPVVLPDLRGCRRGRLSLCWHASGFLRQGRWSGLPARFSDVMAACAILFPHFVLVLFVFPVPIRVMAVLLAVTSFLVVLMPGRQRRRRGGPFRRHGGRSGLCAAVIRDGTGSR